MYTIKHLLCPSVCILIMMELNIDYLKSTKIGKYNELCQIYTLRFTNHVPLLNGDMLYYNIRFNVHILFFH